MDAQQLTNVWTALLNNLLELQEGGIKVRAAVEELAEQAPSDMAIRALIGELLANEPMTQDFFAACPP